MLKVPTMMTDRELLKLAARAAGLIPPPNGMEVCDGGPMSKGGLVFSGNGTCMDWNPLADDGDALRLAVKGRITVTYSGDSTSCFTVSEDGRSGHESVQPWGDDPCAATRRAIVRAAAEIARSTPYGE